MKHSHGWSVLLCFLTGCSTHPLVDVLDFFKPGKMYPTQPGLTPYGGVGIPQGAIVPPAPGLPLAGVPLVPPAAGVGVVPAPLPLPGNQPPPGFQLQPPTPGVGEVPLPPTPPPRPF